LSKILIIEDEKLIRESIAEYLELEGYECIQAKSGEEGIASAKEKLPDLIISDIKMPGINGHQVLKELRSNEKTSHIPFIFLSALVDKEHLREGMLLGADDYITKPFQPDELLAVVQVRLNKYLAIKKKLELLKDSVSYSLPHELKTPLIAILGYSEILIDKFTDSSDSEALEFSKAIYSAGMRLNRLTQQFIIYEKLSFLSDNPESISKTSLTEFTSNMLETILTKIADRYNRVDDIVKELSDGKTKIPQTLFFTVFEELIDNAFKFSEQRTKVFVETKNKDNYFVITILDEGRGMTDEQIKNIGAYRQFDREKYEQQGIGLGLVIAKKITEIYNGHFEIASEPGEGTRIKFKLPSG